MLKVGERLARGDPLEAIRAAIEAGFDAGTFRAPTTGGVAYMLAGDVELDTATGAVVKQAFPGHYMFYAVGASNEQLGSTPDARRNDPAQPFVFAAGAGGGRGLSYIIAVPGGTHAHPAQ